ncbi:MAG: hypothetical protein ABJC12_02790 [Saprospiraceae bacterium]
MIKDHIHIATHQLNEELKIEKIKDPILYVKMLEEFSNKLDKDQWEGYLNLFELFSSKKINKNTNLYKTINILFQFRGFLVHGCELEILVNDSKNGKYTLSSENRKLKPILAYCVENKLEFVDFELKRVNILSNKLTNHFYDAMLKFSIELYDLLPDSMKAYTKIDMFEFNN